MALRRVSIACFVGLTLFAAEGAQADPVSQPVPQVLSASDAEQYRAIFAAERAGQFDKADRLLAQVSDTSLKGYVLAEQYLSGRGARVPVTTLVSWLAEYRDLAIADRIYRLAVKRSTKKKRHHHKTVLYAVVTNIPAPLGISHQRGGGYEDVNIPDPPISSDAARAAQGPITAAIKSDAPDQAMAVLQPLIDSNSVPVYDVGRLKQRVAASYFAEGLDQQAYNLASSASDEEKRAAPLLYWNAGLAAFRLGMFAESSKYFETLAQVGSVPNWVRGGAAFWAARAYTRQGDPSRVITLLTVAAHEEPTFYGLLAEKLLGQDTQSGFSEPVLDQASFSQLMLVPAAHRAKALSEVGETEHVSRELERAFAESDTKLDPAFAALARHLDVPNLELRASEISASRGIVLTGLFPVPQYEPEGGYTIDPSLVLAFARAESRFHADAVSPAGARGLMQIMPGTATHIAGPGAVSRLTDARYNMTLGQRYVAELLNMYNDNLVELCAAYNAGPLKVQNWMAAREGKEDDALLFIESMRAPETRLYVKRLLTYHWMYRRRLGLDATTLAEAASGNWPTYKPPRQTAPPPPPPAPAEDKDNDLPAD
jgi:soluble lytic murein transglycosylase-like protein